MVNLVQWMVYQIGNIRQASVSFDRRQVARKKTPQEVEALYKAKLEKSGRGLRFPGNP
jgi:hypothetical protein